MAKLHEIGLILVLMHMNLQACPTGLFRLYLKLKDVCLVDQQFFAILIVVKPLCVMKNVERGGSSQIIELLLRVRDAIVRDLSVKILLILDEVARRYNQFEAAGVGLGYFAVSDKWILVIPVNTLEATRLVGDQVHELALIQQDIII